MGAVPRIVYLIGAGGSNACVKWVKSPYGILMQDLSIPLGNKLRPLLETEYSGHENLVTLVNTVIDENTDIEHVITFLDDAPSKLHRDFAGEMRKAFEEVLRERLREIEKDHGGHPVHLYAALLDMHRITDLPERLGGIITTNYDEYIEEAMTEKHDGSVDFGFELASSSTEPRKLKLLKLHGSFGWQDTWPLSRGTAGDTLWLPPGINKVKQRYPFNVVWGLARELLSCDILRIIGCRIGANDWDLISLLFTTRHINSTSQPYRIEVIDAPSRVEQFRTSFPYLEVRSLFELDEIGDRFLKKIAGESSPNFGDLGKQEREALVRKAGENENWFELWLRFKAETVFEELGSVETETGLFAEFLAGG